MNAFTYRCNSFNFLQSCLRIEKKKTLLMLSYLFFKGERDHADLLDNVSFGKRQFYFFQEVKKIKQDQQNHFHVKPSNVFFFACFFMTSRSVLYCSSQFNSNIKTVTANAALFLSVWVFWCRSVSCVSPGLFAGRALQMEDDLVISFQLLLCTLELFIKRCSSDQLQSLYRKPQQHFIQISSIQIFESPFQQEKEIIIGKQIIMT